MSTKKWQKYRINYGAKIDKGKAIIIIIIIIIMEYNKEECQGNRKKKMQG
jgi:hypothetical protein